MEGIGPVSVTVDGGNVRRIPILVTYENASSVAIDIDYSAAIYSWTANISSLSRLCSDGEDLARLQQSYLFFGLLSKFLDCHISPSMLSKDGSIDLDHPQMHEAFGKWKLRHFCLDRDQRRLFVEQQYSLLVEVIHLADIFDNAIGSFNVKDHSYDRVALSIQLLVDFLMLLLNDTNSLSPGRFRSLINRAVPSFTVPTGHDRRSGIRGMLSNVTYAQLLQETRGSLVAVRQGRTQNSATKHLIQMFVQNGWCPARAQQLCRAHDYLVVNYMASVQLPSLPDLHTQCAGKPKCEAFVLNTLSMQSYIIRHIDDDDCDLTPNFTHKVSSIIRSGAIPLISIAASSDDLDPQIVACTHFTKYVAISHVWSDGMGNPSRNSVPYCQLHRLRKLIMQCDKFENSHLYESSVGVRARLLNRYTWEFGESVRPGRPMRQKNTSRIYFWMDTICIPASIETFTMLDDANIKLRAIKHITPIFAGAHRVLILDSGLQRFRFRRQGVHDEDVVSAILASTWMQRGWTLEEGVLGANCVFELHDVFFDLHHMLLVRKRKAWDETSPLRKAFDLVKHRLLGTLKADLLHERHELNVDRHGANSFLNDLIRGPHFVRIWNSLNQRTITKQRDMVYIMATLLNFNIYALKEVAIQDRLRVLLQQCDHLPLSLLYNTGPRWQVSGHPELGWIPTEIGPTFLSIGGNMTRAVSFRDTSFALDPIGLGSNNVVLTEIAGLQSRPMLPSIFLIHRSARNEFPATSLVVKVDRVPTVEDLQHFQPTIQQHPLLLLLDFRCGSMAFRSVRGRGALFKILSDFEGSTRLSFVSALEIYTSDQWPFQLSCPSADLPFEESVERDFGKFNITLVADVDIWPRVLAERPLSLQHPRKAQTVETLVVIMVWLVLVFSIAAIAQQLLSEKVYNSDRFNAYLVLLSIPVARWPASIVQQRLAQRSYHSWLASFDDPADVMTRERVLSSVFRAMKDSLRFLRLPSRSQVSERSGDGEIELV